MVTSVLLDGTSTSLSEYLQNERVVNNVRQASHMAWHRDNLTRTLSFFGPNLRPRTSSESIGGDFNEFICESDVVLYVR